MAGGRNSFSEAMKRGHNAAWDGQWKKAIAEYRRAVQEAPQDPTGHQSLAHALEQDGQLQAALAECQNCSQLRPDDPEPLMKAANIQEKLGLLSEAAGTFLVIADVYVARHSAEQAVEMWQRAAALEPSRADVHVQLAQVYEKSGRSVLAAKEYTALSRIYQKRGDRAKALAMAERALAIDPRNPVAKTLGDENKPKATTAPDDATGTLDIAQRTAMTRLADNLLADGGAVQKANVREENPTRPETLLSPADAQALMAQGVDALSSQRTLEAIRIFRRLADAGWAKSEVKINLGLLYIQVMQYDEAISILKQVTPDPEYAIASHLALGRCYRSNGRIDLAVAEFLDAIKAVDLKNVRPDQAVELASAYSAAASSLKADGRSMEQLFSALESFVIRQDWENEARDLRKNLEKLRGDGGQISLAEVLLIPESSRLFESLSLSKDYLEQGHVRAASDEVLRAIELVSDYLPSHDQLAQILVRSGRINEACTKYNVLADLCTARSDLVRAEKYYRQSLKLAPADAAVRSELIVVLSSQGCSDSALAEYAILAEEYCRAGEKEKAIEACEKGIALGQSTGIQGAEIGKLEDMKKQIRHIGSQGQAEKTRIPISGATQESTVDRLAAQFANGQSALAQQAMDEALGEYQIQGETSKAVELLRALVERVPREFAPRERLAQFYSAIGDKVQAVAALDTLGELQMGMGDKDGASNTIRRIISLNPPNVEEYRKLLHQIAD